MSVLQTPPPPPPPPRVATVHRDDYVTMRSVLLYRLRGRSRLVIEYTTTPMCSIYRTGLPSRGGELCGGDGGTGGGREADGGDGERRALVRMMSCSFELT